MYIALHLNTYKQIARPAADPLMRKRKQENKFGSHGDKKQKMVDDGLSPGERLKNSVTPLWKLEYKEQLLVSIPQNDLPVYFVIKLMYDQRLQNTHIYWSKKYF